MKQSKLTQQIQFNTQQTQSNHLLDVYIRNNKKQALLIHTRQFTNINHIIHTITHKFKIPKSQQLLFYNGEQVNYNKTASLRLQHKSIIHLVDQRNITKNIVINLRRLHIPTSQQYKISTQQIIEDFIVRNLSQEDYKQMFLVYTGRQLNPKKSFKEEFVENNSQLFCLHVNHDQVKGQSRKKYQKRLQQIQKKHKQRENQMANSNKSMHSQQLNKKKQIIQANNQKIEQKQTKQQSEQIQNLTPNFKKKTNTKQITIINNKQIQVKTNIAPIIEHNSSSMILQNNLNKSNIIVSPNNFFIEGSSISQIMAQDFHNPQSSKRQTSVMFQSAIIGLNNQNSIINNQNINIRGISSLIQNPNQEQNPDESSQKNLSINFEVRAPQMLQERDIIHQEFITQQQNEDWSESNSIQRHQRSKNVSTKRQLQQKGQLQQQGHLKRQLFEQDISQFELQRVQNHKLSVSADIDAGQLFTQNRIDNQQQIKYMNDLGMQIQPIINHHQQQPQINLHLVEQQQSNQENQSSYKLQYKKQQSLQIVYDQSKQTSLNNQKFEEINVYYIPGSQIRQIATQSQVIQQKQECQTNGRQGSNSNFHSSNSSRAKRSHFQSQTQEMDHYRELKRFSRFNKEINSLENRDIIEEENISKLLENKEEQMLESEYDSGQKKQALPSAQHQYQFQNNKKSNQDQENSFQIIERNSIRNSSIIAYQHDSKAIQDWSHQNKRQHPFLPRDTPSHLSKIQQLNNLYSQIHPKPTNYLQQKQKEELPQIQIKDYKIIPKKYDNQSQSQSNLLDNPAPIHLNNQVKQYQNEEGNIIKVSLTDNTLQNKKINQMFIIAQQQKQQMKIINNNKYDYDYGYELNNFIYKKQLNLFNPFNYFINDMSRQYSIRQQ